MCLAATPRADSLNALYSMTNSGAGEASSKAVMPTLK